MHGSTLGAAEIRVEELTLLGEVEVGVEELTLLDARPSDAAGFSIGRRCLSCSSQASYIINSCTYAAKLFLESLDN